MLTANSRLHPERPASQPLLECPQLDARRPPTRVHSGRIRTAAHCRQCTFREVPFTTTFSSTL